MPAPASSGGEAAWGDRWAAPAAGLILAVLTVYLAFNAGGFFPGAVAYATIAVAVLLVLGIMLVHEPLTDSPPALLVTIGSLAGFAALTLLSGSWSHSWSRAIIEFDRVLLYVLVLAFFGLLRRREGALEWGLRGFVLAAFVICVVAWITRVAPDVWPISIDVQPQRLSFPLTYWNALGLLSALGAIGLLHLSSGDDQGRLTRISGAAMPLMLSTLLLTFSRSALALTAIGLIFYLFLVRPRRAIAAAAALVLPVAVALAASVRANTVSSARYTSDAGISQGHHLALIVIGCVVSAALLRWWALRLDDRLDGWQPPRFAPAKVAVVVAGTLSVLVLVGVAAGGPNWVKRHWDSFVQENQVGHVKNPSERLSSVGNNGRIPQWRVAIDAFDEAPLLGKGAGTYALQWDQNRPLQYTVVNAHSLYVEVMAELGIVGLLALLAGLLTLLIGTARRLSQPDGQAYGAFLVLAVIWMLHAGVDWDWQMPAITIWLFALGGLALSRPLATRREASEVEVGRLPRIVAALCVSVLAVTPVIVALSQTRLESALNAFDANRCPTAINSSLSSLNALSVRPEPYEILGYCDIRLRQYALAQKAMESAVSRDPENWEMHYGLAMSQAAQGADPMSQLRETSRLNPLEPLVIEEVERFERAKGPAQRKRLAENAGLPL
ncbi:MAG TPA: O-antigen ligase family protein [Solirubrobacterales bacterium]|nr:O-antigen ligase family protein [Solirubrobacterales bacterium]